MAGFLDSAAFAIYALLAGLAIPAGGLLARIETLRPGWLEQEFRHTVIAFGGGVLIGAVGLVLVPEGLSRLSLAAALGAFAAGGILAFAVDRAIEQRGTSAAQLLAMVLDFVPEAMAMGAMLATGNPAGVLLAALIGLQNIPEGFNAYRELTEKSGITSRRALALFFLLSLLGPISALIGVALLSEAEMVLGAVMLTAAGGILYLTFEDIAPQVPLEKSWAPPLGDVAGFLLCMLGQGLLH